MISKTIMILAIATILIGSVSVSHVAFADDDKDSKKEPKTFESECAKKLNKKKLNLDGLFCAAIIGLQEQISSLTFIQTDPNEPALELQVDPSSTEPALVVNDGTNALFTVNNDGSIQIGSNTVIINPDGTVTGGPLHLESGSTVDGQLISTEPDEVGSSGDDLGSHVATQDLDMSGNSILDVNEVSSDTFSFVNPEVRTIRIGANSLMGINDVSVAYNGGGGSMYFRGTSGTDAVDQIALGSVQNIPLGAKVTGFECDILDASSTHSTYCYLGIFTDSGIGFGGDASTSHSFSSTSVQQIVSTNTTPFVVDESTSLGIHYSTTKGCDSNCQFYAAKITYEVSKVD